LSDNDGSNEIGFTKEDVAALIRPCDGYGSLKGKCPHEGVVLRLWETDVIKEFWLCLACDALCKLDIKIYLSEQRPNDAEIEY